MRYSAVMLFSSLTEISVWGITPPSLRFLNEIHMMSEEKHTDAKIRIMLTLSVTKKAFFQVCS